MWPVGTIPHGFLLVFRLKLWQVAGHLAKTWRLRCGDRCKPKSENSWYHAILHFQAARDLPVDRSTALLGGNPWRRPTPGSGWPHNPPAIVAEVLFWDKNVTNSETRLKTHRLWMVLSIFGGFVVGNVCSEVVINWG